MKKFLLGTIAAFAFTGSVEAQPADVFTAYCIGVLEIDRAHGLLDRALFGLGIDVPSLDKRIEQLRTYLFSHWSHVDIDAFNIALEAGIDDANECYKTGHERTRACNKAARDKNNPSVVDRDLFVSCQHTLELNVGACQR